MSKLQSVAPPELEKDIPPRHPTRLDMKAVWAAERALRGKRIELKKIVSRFNQEIIELENEFEQTCFELAKLCGISPGLALDTDRMKWQMLQNPGEDKPTYKTLDIERWKEGL